MCLRKIKFRKKGALFANAARARVCQENKVPEKKLYSPALRARVSQENKVPEKGALFANTVRPCVSGRKVPETKRFIRQRCAGACVSEKLINVRKKRLVRQPCALVCLRKKPSFGTKKFIGTRCAPVCLRKTQFWNKGALFASALRPSGKHQRCAPVCLRKIKFRGKRALFASARSPQQIILKGSLPWAGLNQ